MAEKSFGVKEINLIGVSGTPTIESPNNLNLSAVNVAISTNVSVGGTVTVSGDMGVNHINAVGIITAGSGLISDGISTFTSDIEAGSGNPGQININPTTSTSNGRIKYYGTKTFMIDGGTSSDNKIEIYGHQNSLNILCEGQGETELHHNGSKKLSTTTTGIDVTGGITVNGSALSIEPSDTDVQVTFDIAGNSSGGYTFTGPGNDGTTGNPDIYLIRGQRYRFNNTTTTNHPFEFRNADNNADYTDGISGSQSGIQDFNVQYDAPARLKYRCTIHTSTMIGDIYIVGAFPKISVSGQSDVVADNLADTLTLAAGSNITLTTNASTDTITIAASSGTNNYVSSLSWNTTNGVLSLGRSGLSLLTVDLDGRYSTTDTNYYANSLSFNTTSGVLTLGRSGLSNLTVDLDGKYAESSHTHSYAATSHTHSYAETSHTHSYAATSHTHSYAATSHTHSYLDSSSSLNASNLLSGTVNNARLPTSIDLGNSGTITTREYKTTGQTNILQNAGVSIHYPAGGLEGLSIVKTGSGWGTALFINSKSSSLNFVEFQQNNAGSGGISKSGSGCAFNTGSDYRLKKDITPITNATTKLKSLNPVDFKWKNNSDDTFVSGFIAHEVQETGYFNHMVTGVKDGMRNNYDDPETQEEDYQSVDYSKFTPMLVAALKEISDKVDALDTRITSLENT